MKQAVLITTAMFFTMSIMAQTKAKHKKTITENSAAEITLKTFADSASYALGLNISQSLKKDLAGLNTAAFMSAMKTVFDNQTPKFNETQIKAILTEFSKRKEAKQSQTVVAQGRAFLAKNKSNPTIKTTPSGLQYEVLKEGSGVKPIATDTVVCNYKGTLIDGTQFDNSYDRGEPLSILVANVIPGWTEGLQLMPKGAKYRFYIPYELGYGLKGAGEIPPGAALIFEIELLDVKKAK